MLLQSSPSPLLPYVYLSMIFFFSWTILVIFKYIIRDYKRYGTLKHKHIQTMLIMIFCIVLSIIIIIRFGKLEVQDFHEVQSAHNLWFVLGAVPILEIGTGLTMTLIHFIFQKPKILRTGKELPLIKTEEHKRIRLHFIRKSFHIFFFFGLLLLFFIQGMVYTNKPYHTVYEFWGNHDGSNLIFQLWDKDNPFFVGQATSIGAYYIATVSTLFIEISKLSHWLKFPLVQQVQRTQQEHEFNTFATHCHVALGNLVAALILPVNLFIACFSLFCFSDTVSAAVGIKYGTHKIPNSSKSWEGLFSGIMATILITYLFVGWIWALFTAVVFALIDLMAPNKIKISDNLLFPLLTVLGYFLLSILHIPAQFPLGHWFGLV